jgi:hypothetical protein
VNQYASRIRYLIGGEKTPAVRYAAILTVLTDTVTTLYVLYVQADTGSELNPLGAFLRTQGMIGEILFMAVPLFSVLLLLYLPGLIGDAVAVTNIGIHLFATGVNLIHPSGTAFASVTGIPLVPTYKAAILLATLLGVLIYLPRLYRRSRTGTAEQNDG